MLCFSAKAAIYRNLMFLFFVHENMKKFPANVKYLTTNIFESGPMPTP